MSKDEGGWNSSFSEKPVRSRLRRLVDWINLTGSGDAFGHIGTGVGAMQAGNGCL